MNLIEELKRPFNLLSTVIAVFSLLISIYFYFDSQKEREPYFLATEASQIYKKSNSTPNLVLLDKRGNKIDGDVHLLEFSFWNGGRQSIEFSDIRTPVYVELPAGSKIVDYSVVKQNKPNISKFKVTPTAEDQDQLRRLLLSWDHLDPGLGAKIQVIYVGAKSAPLIFGGDILDAKIKDGSSIANRVLGMLCITPPPMCLHDWPGAATI